MHRCDKTKLRLTKGPLIERVELVAKPEFKHEARITSFDWRTREGVRYHLGYLGSLKVGVKACD